MRIIFILIVFVCSFIPYHIVKNDWSKELKLKRTVIATGYSSRKCETDATPHITASNKRVRDGFIACNFLKFGTKIRIPHIFGNKIFVVEDRMHRRKKNHVDIWFASTHDAKKFGRRKNVIIEVIG